MSDYNSVRTHYLDNRYKVQNKQKVMAYLQLHLDNPGLHPDDSLSEDGGYQGWHVLLAEEVFTYKELPSDIHYPAWLQFLVRSLQDLQEFHTDGTPNAEYQLVKSLINQLPGLSATDLPQIIEQLNDLVVFHFGAPEEVLEPLVTAVDCFCWINNMEKEDSGLKLSWSVWNSGGGCMIHSYDFQTSDDKTYSVQVSDEAVVLVDMSSEDYWALEDLDDEARHALVPIIWYNDGRYICKEFCPYTGQELADLIDEDVQKIWAL